MPAGSLRRFCMLPALVLALLGATGAAAQTSPAYPAKPIRLIVTFAAGGSSDALARATAKAMTEGLGTSVYVENRPGAGGNIGAELAAHATPDGYTMLFGTIGTHGIGPALYKHLTYSPVNDLAPVGLLHTLPNVLIVHASLPIHSLQDLLKYAREHPGELTFASAGSGSVSHLAGELLKSSAGIDIVHVPYKGGGAATADLLAGRVSMMLETIPNALPLVESGQMRALAVTTPKRSAAAPDLPTFAEAGLPGFAVSSWTGLLVPAGTPPAIIDRLNAETIRIAHDPAYLAQMKALGTDAATSTPEEFGQFIKTEIATWSATIDRAGVKID